MAQYFTPILTGAPATALMFNSPLQELDNAIAALGAPAWVIVTAAPYNADPTGVTDATTAIQSAINACAAAGGGIVYLPPGTFRITGALLVTTSGITLHGAGLLVTQIYCNSATATAIYADGGVSGITHFSVQDMRITCKSSSDTRTAGKGIHIYHVGNWHIENVTIHYGWDAVYLDAASSGWMRNIFVDGDSGVTGGGLNRGVTWIGADSTHRCIFNHAYNTHVSCPATYDAGYQIDSGTDGLFMYGCTAGGVGMAVGYRLDNNSGAIDPVFLRINDPVVEPDNATGKGFELKRGQDVIISAPYSYKGLYGVHFSSNGGTAPLGVEIKGGWISGAQQWGILMDAGSNIDIHDAKIWRNSQAGSGLYYGVGIADTIANLHLYNNSIGNFALLGVGAPYQKGIYIAPSNTNLMQIDHNDLTNNVSVMDVGAGLTNTRIHDNPGYNPVGVSAISPGASPYTYTAGNSPETVYIFGGTVSSVTRDGAQIATATGLNVELQPHQAVIVTYSSAPTMIKDIK